MSSAEPQKSQNPQPPQLPQARAPQHPMNNQAPTDLEFFASLLRTAADEKNGASGEPEPPQPNGEPPQKPDDGPLEMLSDLGKRLKLDDAALYKIKVPSARQGAEPFTLGQLKDLAAEHDSFTVQQLQHAEEARQRTAQFARAEQELQDILALLPPDAIKPETRQKIADRRNKALLAERQRVLDAIPEWQNAETRTQEIESMIEHLKDYGFPEAYLGTVLDHRTLRYIRANWQREKQLRAALERVKERKPAVPPKSSKQSAPPKKQVSDSNQPQQLRGVSDFAQILQRAANTQ